ncbi:protein ASPARTIC PROTEASE IN GUARD cell 2-like [Dorcoceras hygrometricum]|uniref:Protein ASPARTIC PROTEASE IN GUARD cell 2-like n=1 Tax=Dorcoceras hygrometricum TaxID=472368 RepID=A0A2Z7AWS8_9LAMI|nr:protein ASPARTIC PROTEASE IN GUARD cell 2-like [Dorcoceras hygrometricum]
MHSSTKSATEYVATGLTNPSREMRVRNHRSPSHPGTTEQQHRNKAMAATTDGMILVGAIRVFLLVVQLRANVNDGQLYCSLRLVSCSLRLVLREDYRPDLMTYEMRRRFIKLERSVLMQRLVSAFECYTIQLLDLRTSRWL